MSDFARISKNSIYSFLSIFFRLFTNIIVFWIIARHFGKEIFGQFTLAQTFASVFILFADFGLDILLTTELPRNIKNAVEIFQKYFSIKIILSSVAFIGMISLSLLSNFSDQAKDLIIIFSFYVVFSTLTNFLYAFYKGNEKLEYETKVSFSANLGVLFIVLFLIFSGGSIIIISLVFVIMRLFGLFLAIFFAHKILPSISFRINFEGFSTIKNQVIIFGVFLIFGNLFFQLDTILLAYWKGEESVGVYQAVIRLIMLPLVIPDIFISSFMPALSRLFISDNSKWNKLGFLFNKLLIVLVVPISIVLFVFSEELIMLIYGKDEYIQAVPILKIFAVIIFIRFLAEAYGLMLTTAKKQNKRMVIVISATMINFVINALLIPRFGLIGAAITSLITNFMVGLFYYLYAKPLVSNWFKGVFTLQFLLLTLFVAVSLWLFSLTNFWYLGCVSLGIYLLFVYKLLLSDEEKKWFSDFNLIKILTLSRSK